MFLFTTLMANQARIIEISTPPLVQGYGGFIPSSTQKDRGFVFPRPAAFSFLDSQAPFSSYLLTSPPGFCATSVAKALAYWLDCNRDSTVDAIYRPHFPNNLPEPDALVLFIHLSQLDRSAEQRTIPRYSDIIKIINTSVWKSARAFVIACTTRLKGAKELYESKFKLKTVTLTAIEIIQEILVLVRECDQKFTVIIDGYDAFLLFCWSRHRVSPAYCRLADEIGPYLYRIFATLGENLSAEKGIKKVYVFGASEGNRSLLEGIPRLINLTREPQLDGLFGFTQGEVKALCQAICKPDQDWRSLSKAVLKSCPDRQIRLHNGDLSAKLFAPYGIIFFLKSRQARPYLGDFRFKPPSGYIPSILPQLLRVSGYLLNQLPDKGTIRSEILAGTGLVFESSNPVSMLEMMGCDRPSRDRVFTSLGDIGLLVTAGPGTVRPLDISAERTWTSAIRSFSPQIIQEVWEKYVAELNSPHNAGKIEREENFQPVLGFLLRRITQAAILELPLKWQYLGRVGFVDIFVMADGSYFFIELKNIPLKLILDAGNEGIASLEDLRRYYRSGKELKTIEYLTWYSLSESPTMNVLDCHGKKQFRYTVGELQAAAERQVIGYMEMASRGQFEDVRTTVYVVGDHDVRVGQLRIDTSKNSPIPIRCVVGISLAGVANIFEEVHKTDPAGRPQTFFTTTHFHV
ncbi:hypothetical protein D9757_012144 [Collybiopsis confluens]|uniref:Uncharacterized protein n=1 Tax=Collybiopsis confluens TaxID=2823264 RepID=A0A8H5G850_9AGAR|nr:hypothetical protein D9757_012144 [Collybiopsis confluens]